MKLKPLKEQVIVITGATSGIGLVTARRAAKQGARLVLVSRNEEALQELLTELAAQGAAAIYCPADVANESELQKAANQAIQHFGQIDTWVNNAGVSIYGNIADVSVPDHRRLFETNFWGTVYGSRIAVEHMRQNGGALINIGSVLSDRSIPLQGMYCASKHAVKGFTDALRMELEEQKAPISVTLIKPSAVDTPYTKHAKNYMGVAPQNPPPVYAPEVVADAILHCAEHPERDVIVGGGGKGMSAGGYYAPRITDKLMQWAMFDQQKTSEPPETDALYSPSGGLRERGGYKGHVAESSIYTKASLHPFTTGLVLLGAGLAVAALWKPQTVRKITDGI